jgi:hypothetical protein
VATLGGTHDLGRFRSLIAVSAPSHCSLFISMQKRNCSNTREKQQRTRSFALVPAGPSSPVAGSPSPTVRDVIRTRTGAPSTRTGTGTRIVHRSTRRAFAVKGRGGEEAEPQRGPERPARATPAGHRAWPRPSARAQTDHVCDAALFVRGVFPCARVYFLARRSLPSVMPCYPTPQPPPVWCLLVLFFHRLLWQPQVPVGVEGHARAPLAARPRPASCVRALFLLLSVPSFRKDTCMHT